MKKAVWLFVLLFTIVIVACKGEKKSQKESSDIESPAIIVENFLAGNTYHIGHKYGENGILSNQRWTRLKEHENNNIDYIYGTFIYFEESQHYNRFYTAPCGSDCFFSEYGRYNLSSPKTLELIIDSIQYWGECSQPTIYGNGKAKIYTITEFQGDSIFKVYPVE